MPPAARAAGVARGPRDPARAVGHSARPARVVARQAARPGRGRPRRSGWRPRSARTAARRGAPGPPRGWRPRCCAGRPTGGPAVDRRHRARQPGPDRQRHRDQRRRAGRRPRPAARRPRPVAGRWRHPRSSRRCSRGTCPRRRSDGASSSGTPAAYGAGRRDVKHVERRPVGRPPFEARGMDVLRFGGPSSGPVGQRLSSTREAQPAAEPILWVSPPPLACGPSGRTIWSLSLLTVCDWTMVVAAACGAL